MKQAIVTLITVILTACSEVALDMRTAIDISATAPRKAVAVKSGMNNSGALNAEYIIAAASDTVFNMTLDAGGPEIRLMFRGGSRHGDTRSQWNSDSVQRRLCRVFE
jgi:hypothetical protein